MPDTVNSSRSGPPFSNSSWRQRPHGMITLAVAVDADDCASRPPPVMCSWETIPHSAHRPTPYAAFSTLQPATTRPSSTSPAAPTGKLEYGA